MWVAPMTCPMTRWPLSCGVGIGLVRWTLRKGIRMGDYWDMMGTGDAWCDRFGNQVDPRTFPNEDELVAAGYHHVNQGRAPLDWIARELGTVERRSIPTESLGRDA